MTLILPKGSLIRLDGIDLSEHNRSSASIGYKSIGTSNITILGRTRKQQITMKRTLTVSWERLPALDSQTVDGKAGRNTINDNFPEIYWNSFNSTTIEVSYYEVDSDNAQVYVTFNAFLDSYSDELLKRFDSQLWNVSLSLVEE